MAQVQVVRQPRVTRARLDQLATLGELVDSQVYHIIDENRLATAQGTSSYTAYEIEGEASTVQGNLDTHKTSDDHDSRYYPQGSVDSLLGGKADVSHSHTLSEITDAGTAAALDIAATGDAAVGEVVVGNDTRLTDSRTPSAHGHVLSEITDAGTAAAADTGISVGDVVALADIGGGTPGLPAVDGSQLTGLPSVSSDPVPVTESRALSAADTGKSFFAEAAGTIVFTLDAGLPQLWYCNITRIGAGEVHIDIAPGDTVNGQSGTLAIDAQYTNLTVIRTA